MKTGRRAAFCAFAKKEKYFRKGTKGFCGKSCCALGWDGVKYTMNMFGLPQRRAVTAGGNCVDEYHAQRSGPPVQPARGGV